MALGFGATLVTADGRNDGGAGLRGQLKGLPGILGRRAQGEAGGNRSRDRGRAVAGGRRRADRWGRRLRWVARAERVVRALSGRELGRAELGQAGAGAGRAGRPSGVASWAQERSLGCLRLGRPGGESGLGPVAEFWAGLV